MCTDIHLPIGCPVPTHPTITHLTIATVVDLCDGSVRDTMYGEPERREEVASRCPYCVHAAAHAAALAAHSNTTTNTNDDNTIDNPEALALSPKLGPVSVSVAGAVDGGVLMGGDGGDMDFDLDVNALPILDDETVAAMGGGDLDMDLDVNTMLTLDGYDSNCNLMPNLNQPWFGGIIEGQGQQMQTVDFSSLAGGEVVMHNSITYDMGANIGAIGALDAEADSEEYMRQMLDSIDFNTIDWEALFAEFPGLTAGFLEGNNQS